jgi:CHAT domain-containing protein
VVAALWKIPGKTTSEFMGTFYDQLRESGSGTRSHALAEAKRRFARGESSPPQGMSRPSAHPYFWAAFVQTGTPD